MYVYIYIHRDRERERERNASTLPASENLRVFSLQPFLELALLPSESTELPKLQPGMMAYAQLEPFEKNTQRLKANQDLMLITVTIRTIFWQRCDIRTHQIKLRCQNCAREQGWSIIIRLTEIYRITNGVYYSVS